MDQASLPWIYNRIAMTPLMPLAYFCYFSSSIDPSPMATGSPFAGLTTNTTTLLFTTATNTPAPTIVTTCTSFHPISPHPDTVSTEPLLLLAIISLPSWPSSSSPPVNNLAPLMPQHPSPSPAAARFEAPSVQPTTICPLYYFPLSCFCYCLCYCDHFFLSTSSAVSAPPSPTVGTPLPV